MSPPAVPADGLRVGPPRWRYACEIALVFVLFCLQGPWGIPDSNEPNYLAKARHYWDPSWLAGDQFLDTADAHLVFYFTWGWLTKLLPLEQVALVVRLLTWGLLAWAWTRLSWRVVPRAWMAVASAGLLLAIHSQVEMAGEWLIGGAEGKGFAFVFLFLGLGSLAHGRWNAAWLLFGLASAFHVLVGGWSVVAGLLAWLVVGRADCSLRSMLPGLVVGGLLSLPGVLPGIAMSRGVLPDEAARSYEIQVYDRLWHHLYFPWFEKGTIELHLVSAGLWGALLAACYLSVRRRADCGPLSPANLRGRLIGRRGWRVQAFAAGALAITLVGIVISMSVWATSYEVDGRLFHARLGTSLLRFYWFRLGDILLPVGGALVLARLAAALPARRRSYVAPLVLLLAVGAAHLGLKPRNPNPPAFREGPSVSFADWRAACDWVAANTPADATFLSPRNTTTFRWYANRADVANFKDMPQDSRSLLEWWERVLDLHYDRETGGFYDSLSFRTAADLRRLAKKYGATYLITESAETDPPLDLPVVYRNEWFVVYKF